MRYGITIPCFDAYFDVRTVAQLAQTAERVGWDGFFVWDHLLLWPTPIADPWIALTAVALATTRIRLGPLVTPLPRRRPVKLARETITLDHLSGGRLILGVGIGDGPWEWEYLGEEVNRRTRGAMLDEGLDLLTRLWTGEPVLHDGRYYTYRGDGGPNDPSPRPTPVLPGALQAPRIPVWVAGSWPHRRPFARAARWDGVVPLKANAGFGEQPSPEEVGAIVAYTRAHRTDTQPFDVVIGGRTGGVSPEADAEQVRAYEVAGATWWLEDISPWAFGWNWQGAWPVEAMNRRVQAGPPRV